MERREILGTICGGALISISGCLGHLPISDTTSPDEMDSSIDECRENVNWEAYHADIPSNLDPSSIAGQLNCDSTDRPEPTGDLCATHKNGLETVSSAGIRLYPEPPSSFDEDSITEFVYEYEKAYEQNREVEEHGEAVTSPEIVIEEDFTITKQTENNIFMVRIQYFPPSGSYEHENQAVDRDIVAVVYSVDDTGVARTSAETIYEYHESVFEESPDPVKDGALLECFSLGADSIR